MTIYSTDSMTADTVDGGTDQSRRTFVRNLAILAVSGSALKPARLMAATNPERRLNFINTHTREKLDVVYYSHGNYLYDALGEIDQLFRDHRTDEVYPMDQSLLDILHDLSLLTRSRNAFEIISGYRSPASNAMLRRKSHGVARKSYHMVGKAVDIRLPDVNSRTLRNIAVSLKSGGVGYYRKSDFVHVDTGRIRTW